MSRKYSPDPIKLARSSYYDLERVINMIKQIKLLGAGRNMTTQQLDVIEILTVQECQLVRSTWMFKRGTTGDDSDNDDDYC